MTNNTIKICNIFLLIILLLAYGPIANPAMAFDEPVTRAIERAEKKASLQRLEAQNKAKAIDGLYRKGKANYNRGDYASAVANFEALLDTEPSYEPAKLYLECSIIQDKLSQNEEKVYSIKLEMADIMAEYDSRIQEMEGLAFGYLLDQALLRCQSGNFNDADYYYNLCYKLDPQSREQLSWFVNATYELRDLSASLDEIYETIDELPELGLEDLTSID